MEPGQDWSYGSIAVLDAGNDVAPMFERAGIPVTPFEDFESLKSALGNGKHHVAAIAFHAVLPSAQRLLGELSEISTARTVLLYREAVERPRILDRLWASGACHSLLSYATPPERLRAVVQQAYIEALFDYVSKDQGEVGLEPEGAVELLRMFQQLTIALAGHASAHGLLRELSARLPGLIDCSMFGVLLIEAPAKLITFQSAAVDYGLLWELAEKSCEAIAPFKRGAPPIAGELEFLQGPTIHAMEKSGPHEVIAWAMVVSGEPVGSIGIIIEAAHPRRAHILYALRLVASQLATALRQVQLIAELETRSQIDPMTGLPNRQRLHHVLEREWRRAQRYSLHLTVVLLDIDGFARINQMHGAQSGDMVLKRFAELLQQHMRTTDYLLSYGADRFLLLLAETGLTGASILVDGIRVSLQTTPFQVESSQISVAFSAGIASHPANPAASPNDLVALSDIALTEAKREGGGRTVIAQALKGGGSRPADVGERRTRQRLAVELPTTFLPLPEIDFSRLVRLPSINVSAEGIALRDPTRLLKRNNHGLLFFDDRPEPMLCKVVWVRSSEGEHRAGLQSIRSRELLAGSEKGARKKRRALIAVEDDAQRVMFQRVLKSARFDVRPLDLDAADIDPKLLKSSALVVMSSRVLSRPVGQKVMSFRKSDGAGVRLILVNEGLERGQAIDVVSTHRVEHMISGDETQAELLFTTLTKLVQDDYFGARRYLLPGADCKRWAVTDSTEKGYALAGVRTVAEEVSCHPRIIDLLISAVDEMILSMLLSMHTDHSPAGLKPISVECGSDGRFLCVSVLDEYGRMRVDEIYNDLAAAADVRGRDLPEDAGSPRIGFRIMLDALSQISINVEPGNRTEIIGLVDLRRTLKQHRTQAPSIGVFGPTT